MGVESASESPLGRPAKVNLIETADEGCVSRSHAPTVDERAQTQDIGGFLNRAFHDHEFSTPRRETCQGTDYHLFPAINC